MAWAAAAALISRAMSPRRRRRPPSTSGPLPLPRPDAKPTRSMQPGPCRSAAACSTPTAGRSPGPRSTSGGTTRKTLGTPTDPGHARPAGPRSGERRRRPVPFRAGQGRERLPLHDNPVWHEAQDRGRRHGLTGRPGLTAGSLLKGGEATLQLVRDDVPIRGRVVDPQGRPVAGVTVRAYWSCAVSAGIGPRMPCIAAGEFQDGQGDVVLQGPDLAGPPGYLDDRCRRTVRGQGRRTRPDHLARAWRPRAGTARGSTPWPGRRKRRPSHGRGRRARRQE